MEEMTIFQQNRLHDRFTLYKTAYMYNYRFNWFWISFSDDKIAYVKWHHKFKRLFWSVKTALNASITDFLFTLIINMSDSDLVWQIQLIRI